LCLCVRACIYTCSSRTRVYMYTCVLYIPSDIGEVNIQYMAKSHRMPQVADHRERAANHRALLRKMTYADKASYDSTPHETEWLQWVMFFVFVTRMNASCCTYKWGSSHLWVSHVTHINEPSQKNLLCHTYGRVTSHLWMSHVTHVNIGKVQISWKQHLQIQYASHTNEWVIQHIWMSHESLQISMRHDMCQGPALVLWGGTYRSSQRTSLI